MLTGIGLRNFKAFGDEMQEAPLSKITLIYGPNSGGKSSIIQALLLLKQSLKNGYTDESGYPIETRTLMPRGEFVDLGSFYALLHKHDEERKLGVIVRYRNMKLGIGFYENSVYLTCANKNSPGTLSRLDYNIASIESDEVLFNAACAWDNRLYSEVSLLEAQVLEAQVTGNRICNHPCTLPMINSNEFLPLLSLIGLENQRKSALESIRAPEPFDVPDEPELEQAEALDQALKQAQEQAENHVLHWGMELYMEWEQVQERQPTLPESDQAADQAGEQAQEQAQAWEQEWEQEFAQLKLTHEHVVALTPELIPGDYENHLRAFNYLGPLRSAPERLYRLSPRADSSSGITGIQGEFSVNVLYTDDGIRKSVNDWFEQFDIPYGLDVIRLGEASLAGEYITIALTDKRTNTQVTLADVGYGINQILPVIIEGSASQEGSILCVEQPEIHLHPRLQANIADLMIDTIADEQNKRKQWIVETHSELLILRLQRRIREGKIKPEDISVLYVDPNDESTEGSAIKVLRLGEDSYFKDPWPDGFFDEGLKERLPTDDEFEGVDDDTNILDKLFSE